MIKPYELEDIVIPIGTVLGGVIAMVFGYHVMFGITIGLTMGFLLWFCINSLKYKYDKL